MGAKLSHPPDDIIARLLWANRGLGSDPAPWLDYMYRPNTAAPAAAWPVFCDREPGDPAPVNVITVYETTPVLQARIQVTGEQKQLYGVTVRVRGATKAVARQKAEDIRHDLLQGVTGTGLTDQVVAMTSPAEEYLVPCFSQVQLVRVVAPTAQPTAAAVYNLNLLMPILAYPIQG